MNENHLIAWCSGLELDILADPKDSPFFDIPDYFDKPIPGSKLSRWHPKAPEARLLLLEKHQWMDQPISVLVETAIRCCPRKSRFLVPSIVRRKDEFSKCLDFGIPQNVWLLVPFEDDTCSAGPEWEDIRDKVLRGYLWGIDIL